MYKVKCYVNNQALRMLHHSKINSRVQYRIVAWGRAASCHVQPISIVLNRAMRCTNNLWNNKVTTIYKTQKILQLKDIYNLEVSKFMYIYTNSQLPAMFNNYFNSLQMFIHIIKDKSKLDNFLCQKHVQTHTLK